eukprot:TRINITY_DN1769_c0_g1_i1.p1 TRINITY_DN1769_c0_g1~~TRINITY_DN1769_c0_g1_i1.p1  ORF type:complete len:267 (+),score=24.19 TRINITY_DN1769_c0_g1_i1:59-859(+)
MLLRVVNTCLVCYLTPPPSACQRKFPSKFESRKTGLSLTFRSRRYGSEKLQTVLKAVYRDGTANEWKEEATGRLQEVFGERLFRAVAGATSAPLAQFISSPKTFLHSLDPRVKQLLQSASLCLATTTPEQLAAALRWYMLPSVHFGVPVDEIILTLLLSLRFISLVFDEVRNTALGMVARGIQWKKLTMLETVDIFGLYLRRIFYNLFSHAEQISQAMIARGFPGNPSAHKIYLPARFSIRKTDILAVVLLGCLMGLAIHYECYCL